MTYLAREQDNPAATADCLEKIDCSSKFLLGLINDILDMNAHLSKPIDPELMYGTLAHLISNQED